MRYAQVLNNKVNWIEVEPDKVQELRNLGVTILDSCDAAQGDYTYDGGQTFTKKPKRQVTTIDAESFFERFSEADQETLVTHSNSRVQNFLYKLRLKKQVDLQAPKLIAAVQALESNGIITTPASEILRIE